MSKRAKNYRYPLRLAAEDESQISALVKKSGQSVNSILVLCIRQGLPNVQRAFTKDSDRVTAVDPLPDEVLERIYAQRDELDEISARELFEFQSRTEPE